MLSQYTQDQLIEQFQRHAEVWCDNRGTVLRIFRIGPSRRDVITLQDGEFSAGSKLAEQILVKGFTELQSPERKRGLTYTSLRHGGRIQLSKDELNQLRASVSQESTKPQPPQGAIDQDLVVIESVGDREVARLTFEGWDAMRLLLIA